MTLCEAIIINQAAGGQKLFKNRIPKHPQFINLPDGRIGYILKCATPGVLVGVPSKLTKANVYLDVTILTHEEAKQCLTIKEGINYEN